MIARVNDPRNQAHFDLLGISPTVCATSSIMALVEHEVPEHELIHLLELRKENLEIVEVQIDSDSPVAGKRVERLKLPEGARLISVMRDGRRRSPSARPSSRRATRCSRSSSPARKTSSAGFCSSADAVRLRRERSPPASLAARCGRPRFRVTAHARQAATTGRASAGTQSRTSAPTFPTGITAANVRSLNASRCSSTGPSTPRRSISTASRSAAATQTSSSSRRRTGRPTRSTRRAASCSGGSRRRVTRRGPAGRRSRTRRRSPTRAASGSTRPRRRPHLQALGRKRPRGVERLDHEAAVAREDRGPAELRERACDRDDRRLRRRRAAVPGARGDHQSRTAGCSTSGTRSARTAQG